MKKYKADELKGFFTDEIFISKFKNLFSLKLLFEYTIIRDSYVVSPSFNDAVVLSTYGSEIFEKVKNENIEISDEIIKFCLFIEFYHEELLIDISSTNVQEIENQLNKQILDGSVLYPWVYGRVLYDKYFDDFTEQSNFILNDDVLKLLDNTPKGVFQVYNYIVGPLGLIKGKTNRLIPPTKRVKLYHCSNISCSNFHHVYLSSGQHIINNILSSIRRYFSNNNPSDWAEFYDNLVESEEFYYDSNRITETSSLIVNTLGTKEVRLLLKNLIDNNKELRASFPASKFLKGSSEEIVKLLEKDTSYQLLLLEYDEKIIQALERLIDAQIIIIPPTEIRRSVNKSGKGFYSIYHEYNKLGIRPVSTESNLGLRQLNSLINKIYNEPSLQQQLDWKLRYFDRETLKEKIEAYTLEEEPRKIIRETILAGPTQISQTFKTLIGHFEMPLTIEQEEVLVDKILWKLGFDINIYPNYLQKFWERLQKFKEVTRSCIAFNDADKEKIRSVAVNFWISLEEILEQTLSFITWTLLSDHFKETKFNYNFDDARDFMCDQLNGYKVGSNDPLIFDKKGKNTLFPLTEGFTALLEICKDLLDNQSGKYVRSKEGMPIFWHKTDLISFPFENKKYLFDVKPSNYKILSDFISEIPRSFSKFKVLSVRNRTQHKRDNFPSQEEILNACNIVEDIVNKIEINGIYPNVYLFKSTIIDKFNRVKYEYEDYKGRNISLQPTFEFSGSNLPGFKNPQIIVPIIRIGNSHELLRFKYEEGSSYLKFWGNFPRKKQLQENSKVISSTSIDIE
ncbi:hypothetical protein [Spirosoma sordidisoli]|uniref:Uncharacterized protein n=1 Tax=Spirosoma sordidisoli TaxID=2502893 RepID=A0A4Q2ULA3_9BACT|nr:hypothetical protein [Spirosoma sordidisoli]RYC69492.1 hypothetical protein EQG79_12875 [Spirosoma sordidisoli]